MDLHSLKKIKFKSKKRVGRGESSGKGKTSGRGASGQKKREKVKAGFEGGQLPIYLRLPQQRGIGNQPRITAVTISTQQLNKLPEKSIVNEKSLREVGLINKSKKMIKIKIVATGKLQKALQLELPASKKAKELFIKAGGKVTNENPN